MGQKVNPNGFRVGVIRDWNTHWYAAKKDFADFLVEDRKIRANGPTAPPSSILSGMKP